MYKSDAFLSFYSFSSFLFLSLSFPLVEIRNHGVGYYQFSTSEEERQEQMKTLDKLREQVQRHIPCTCLSAYIPCANPPTFSELFLPDSHDRFFVLGLKKLIVIISLFLVTQVMRPKEDLPRGN